MAVVMDKGLQKRLEEVQKRDWWPVTMLAGVLGKPKSYVYRRIECEDFCVLNDGGFIKIESGSVVKYFSEKHL